MKSHNILIDLDQLATVRDRRKAYVGMSRARYKLFLIVTDEVLAKLKSQKT